MKIVRRWFALTLIAVGLSSTAAVYGMQAAPQKAPAGKTDAKPSAAAPTAQEISDARSKGMVWVNTTTKVYHKDGSFYGTTKRGKFMTEDDAIKAGYRAAKTPGSKKKTGSTTK